MAKRSYSYIFRVGPLTSSVYKTEAAAKGGLTRMLKRHAHCGGIPERWLKKHGKLVYEYAVRRMVAGRQGEQ